MRCLALQSENVRALVRSDGSRLEGLGCARCKRTRGRARGERWWLFGGTSGLREHLRGAESGIDTARVEASTIEAEADAASQGGSRELCGV